MGIVIELDQYTKVTCGKHYVPLTATFDLNTNSLKVNTCVRCLREEFERGRQETLNVQSKPAR